MNPLEVTKAFIARINEQDTDGMYELMSEDHRFVDSDGSIHPGRDEMREGWKSYFSMMPDFTIICEQVFYDGSTVAFFGKAKGTYTSDGQLKPENKWAVPAAWKAIIRGEKVVEWRTYVNVEPILEIIEREGQDKEKKT